MQKFLVLILFSGLLFVESCKNDDSKNAAQPASTETESQSFFPVTDFILGQLKEIDSLPVTPLKLMTSNNKTDSVWLQRKDVRIFAQPFLHPVIDSAHLRNMFAEKSFMDQTINSITLSYDPIKKLPDSIQLNHWDVYINPQKNMVERIYITRQKDSNGLQTITQLTWKVNRWCSIRSIVRRNAMPATVSEEKIIWNFDE